MYVEKKKLNYYINNYLYLISYLFSLNVNRINFIYIYSFFSYNLK